MAQRASRRAAVHLLVIVLVVIPRARLVERRIIYALPVRNSWYAPVKVRLGFAAVVLVLLAFIPQLAGARLSVWSNFLVYVIPLSLARAAREEIGSDLVCHLAFRRSGRRCLRALHERLAHSLASRPGAVRAGGGSRRRSDLYPCRPSFWGLLALARSGSGSCSSRWCTTPVPCSG